MAPRWLALLPAALCLGCIDAPVAGDLALEETLPDDELGWRAVPEARDPVAAPDPDPESAAPAEADARPRVVVGRFRGGQVDEWGLAEGAARCPFEVESTGFPAVTTDGAQVVSALRWTPSASDGEDEIMQVQWRDLDDDQLLESRTVFDGASVHRTEGTGPTTCRELHARAVRVAAAVNARLAEESWRPMSPLAIGIHDEAWFDYDVQAREELLTRPAGERPPELTWRWGSLVARIPGVEVLARVPVKWWGTADDFCDPAPHMRAVHADPETGAVAISLDHQSGGCLCYPPDEVHAVRLPPNVFAAVAATPALLPYVES